MNLRIIWNSIVSQFSRRLNMNLLTSETIIPFLDCLTICSIRARMIFSPIRSIPTARLHLWRTLTFLTILWIIRRIFWQSREWLNQLAPKPKFQYFCQILNSSWYLITFTFSVFPWSYYSALCTNRWTNDLLLQKRRWIFIHLRISRIPTYIPKIKGSKCTRDATWIMYVCLDWKWNRGNFARPSSQAAAGAFFDPRRRKGVEFLW